MREGSIVEIDEETFTSAAVRLKTFGGVTRSTPRWLKSPIYT
ncbi:hypothetical protein [Actinoplanes couchii]|nr:hypothetical protein [Actinoplanes couchii]MDR6323023.1 hypothetical protein [Actinoplanes couchii]